MKHRFKFNIVGDYTGSPTSGNLAITGIIFKNITNYYQAVTMYFSTANWIKGYTTKNANTIQWNAGAAASFLSVSGDVEIE